MGNQSRKPRMSEGVYFTGLAVFMLLGIGMIPLGLSGALPIYVYLGLLVGVLVWSWSDPRYVRTSFRDGLWRKREQ